MKRLRWFGMVLVVAVGGCSPAIFAGGPAFSLGGVPGAGLTFSQCSMFAGNSPEAARMGLRSPLVQVGAMRSRVYQIQSRMSLGYTPAATIEGWKRVASGEC